jgi:putative addiction module killer protein
MLFIECDSWITIAICSKLSKAKSLMRGWLALKTAKLCGACWRLDRVRLSNLGDAKFLRDGVSEMRIDYGAGYRLYFTKREGVLVILMCAGDKRTQNKDIEIAIQLAKHWGVEK